MPEKMTIYRVGGERAEMYAVDARRALQAHPNEWFGTAAAAKEAAPKKEATAPVPAPAPAQEAPAAAPVPAPETPALEAKHRGKGSYSVLDASGAEVMEGLSKEDAEAFNAMTADEKAEYVKTENKG